MHLTDFPILVFGISFGALSLCAWLGATIPSRPRAEAARAETDFTVILTASLTLLGLIIGFSFSMATSRYDLRKNYEEAEANAIGTEYLRAGLLPPAVATRTRSLLKSYLEERLKFYDTRDASNLQQINTETTKLQGQLWNEVQAAAAAQPTPTLAAVAVGMNDVLNSQSYTQAAWWNRIPTSAWALMLLIAMLCNVMLGYMARGVKPRGVLLVLLPLVVAIAFALIADIESPRGGLIHVRPQNLESLAATLG
jgi:hypothetical protein